MPGLFFWFKLAAMNKNYILAGAALATFVGYTQYNDFKTFQNSLTFNVKNVKLSSINPQAITLSFNLVITNPVNYAVRAKSLRVNLAFNNNTIAQAYRLQPFAIGANSITTIPAKFTIPYNSAIPGIIALFTNFTQNFTIPITASGVISIGLFNAKFKTNFNLI